MSERIWFSEPNIDDIAHLSQRTLAHHLGIQFTEIGADYLKGTLPVDDRTRQPGGILHGGASAALAETLGSVAAQLCVDRQRFYCVGQEINANHLRTVREGLVTGIARPVHLGRRSQVWEIRMYDDRERMNCISRLTMYVLDRPMPLRNV